MLLALPGYLDGRMAFFRSCRNVPLGRSRWSLIRGHLLSPSLTSGLPIRDQVDVHYEGNVKRTLNIYLKEPEIAERQANGTSASWQDWCHDKHSGLDESEPWASSKNEALARDHFTMQRPTDWEGRCQSPFACMTDQVSGWGVLQVRQCLSRCIHIASEGVEGQSDTGAVSHFPPGMLTETCPLRKPRPFRTPDQKVVGATSLR